MRPRSERTSRLETWRDIISAKREVELKEVAAGREAEEALKSLVTGHISRKSASIFHSKRVPRDSGSVARGLYEIDLIVLSRKQISAIEIKNWSGRLRIDGDKWVQERRNGDEITHENLLVKNKEKLDCLCSLLEAQNVRVPPARVCRVIFWNKNISVPIEVAERDEVIMHHELDRFLTTQKATGFAERFLISVLELCLDQEASLIATDGFFGAVPSRDFTAAIEAITSLETFDRIELLGGRVRAGDLLEIQVGQERFPLKRLQSGSEVKVLCNRSKIMLFFSALFGSAPLISLGYPFNNVSIGPRDKVLFHQAGEPKAEEIEIERIVRMVRG